MGPRRQMRQGSEVVWVYDLGWVLVLQNVLNIDLEI
jgi:hypothetical protein